MDIPKNLFVSFITVILIIFSTSLLLALDFPTKPINIVVGFTPGGTSDLSTRAMVNKMGENLGVPVIVLNKPGAGGILAAEFVARSKPDGYTLYNFSTPFITRASYDTKIPVDIFKDFEPISLFTSQSIVLVVGQDSKFKTIDDVIDFCLKNPGKLSHGNPGIGTGSYFGGELLKATAKINFKQVPFKGEGESVLALMGGHVDLLTAGWSVLSNKVASGDVRILVSFDKTRLPERKDVPTLMELKEKGFSEAFMIGPVGFMAPAGTPKEIIERLDKAVKVATEDPATITALTKMGFFMSYKGPEEVAKFIRSEVTKYSKLSKEAGIVIK